MIANEVTMAKNHPITPPPELVQNWVDTLLPQSSLKAFTAAAQWGGDRELEACCEWLHEELKLTVLTFDVGLRAARRPKPPSLKQQALALLDKAEDPSWDINDFSVVRRALEQLPEDK